MGEEIKKVVIAPIDLTLKVDQDFLNFCKNKLKGLDVEPDKIIVMKVLRKPIRFEVKECAPKKGKIGEKTELIILPRNPLANVTYECTQINAFMTDGQVKQILSDMVLNSEITEENGMKLWQEFKKRQNALQQ
jgi:hypothetical protein